MAIVMATKLKPWPLTDKNVFIFVQLYPWQAKMLCHFVQLSPLQAKNVCLSLCNYDHCKPRMCSLGSKLPSHTLHFCLYKYRWHLFVCHFKLVQYWHIMVRRSSQMWRMACQENLCLPSSSAGQNLGPQDKIEGWRALHLVSKVKHNHGTNLWPSPNLDHNKILDSSKRKVVHLSKGPHGRRKGQTRNGAWAELPFRPLNKGAPLHILARPNIFH